MNKKKMNNWKKYKENAGKTIIRRLYKNGMIKTWYRNKPEGWTIVAGLWSPFYINLRFLPSHPEMLASVGEALGLLIKEECPDVNRIVGVAMAGIPIATAISVKTGIPSGYTRKIEGVNTKEDLSAFVRTIKFIKDYGEHSIVEAVIENGDRIAIVDDVATQFASKELALAQLNFELELREITAECSDVVVLLDREQGAEQSAREQGIALHSLIPFKSKGIDWLSGVLEPREQEVIADYLNNPEKYQDDEIQESLRKEAGTQALR